MVRLSFLLVCPVLLWGCAPRRPPISCPDPGLVAPPAIGGAKAITSLTPLLAGGNWENEVDEAAARFRRADPSISADAVLDVMIAADCPNLVARGVPDARTERDRVATIRERVATILGQ